MINLNFGAVTFNDGLTLEAQTTLSNVEKISGAKLALSVPGRTQLSIGTHSIDGKNWGVGVVFIQSKLNQILLQCLDADGVDSSAWNLENEKLRKNTHDVILKRDCSLNNNVEQSLSSTTYKFEWGKVSSLLDIRGVQALILVEYL